MSATVEALAAALRRLREARGLSQETVAQRAGISLNTYSRIERGTVAPAWLTVAKIAEALDISLAELGAAIDGYAATSGRRVRA